MRYTQIAAELSKRERPDAHWYRIRRLFGDRQFKTISDAGGLKIGNDSFCVIVPNRHGDGVTRVSVFHRGELPHNVLFNMMNYFTMVSGSFNIYACDCLDEVEMTLSGKFHVYNYDGLIAFEEI